MARLVQAWLVALFAAAACPAALRLPAIFSDHMVLQSGQPAAIWGWAGPGERVTVSLAGQSRTATAAADGRWSVKLAPMQAQRRGLPLVVAAGVTLTIRDVLVGEVWLCSGQSNMEMQIKGLHGEVDHADSEIIAASHPLIRMYVYDHWYDFQLPEVPPRVPLPDRPGHWLVCSPQTVSQFSAIGYFFGRELHQQLGVPIGLIESAVGGTPIEAWTSLEAQEARPSLQPLLADWRRRLAGFDAAALYRANSESERRWEREQAAAVATGHPPTGRPIFRNLFVMAPGALFNSMIFPLIPYTLRGALWYQGESNATGPFSELYGDQLATLIGDWRGRWGADFAFGWVQLPRLYREQQTPIEADGWGVKVREGMLKDLSIPRTGMAITIDYGGSASREGHPSNKADYAHRLCLWALHAVYHRGSGAWSGPLFRSVRAVDHRMVLTFDFAQGLMARGGELRGFAIAGPDRKFVWGRAFIRDRGVIVCNDSVPHPAAVRYDWAGNPDGNLYNADQLPASPFRTDNWP